MSPRDQLSYREIQVATTVWEGKTNPEIAAVLGSTEQVVKSQLRGVFRQIGGLEPAGTGPLRGFSRRRKVGRRERQHKSVG
jgi:FixJ family two-component response regulator